MDLSNRTALITGSSSGIGLGIGKALVDAGAFCFFNSPFAHEEDHVIQHVGNHDRCHFICADLSDAKGCVSMVNMTGKRRPAVDILINNAGLQHVSKIEDFDPEQWDKILAVNLSSSFHTIRLLSPGMKKQGWGRIINIASAHGLRASPFKSAYVAAKHGLIGLSKVVALELAETAITCNTICPGYVKTPLVDQQISNQAKVHNIPVERVIRDIILTSQPTRRFTRISDIVSMVLHLISPASDNITGSNITMDGGWTAR